MDLFEVLTVWMKEITAELHLGWTERVVRWKSKSGRKHPSFETGSLWSSTKSLNVRSNINNNDNDNNDNNNNNNNNNNDNNNNITISNNDNDNNNNNNNNNNNA